MGLETRNGETFNDVKYDSIGSWGYGQLGFNYLVEKLRYDGPDSIPEKCQKEP